MPLWKQACASLGALKHYFPVLERKHTCIEFCESA